MASSYTTRKRILKQGTGDSPNSWGVAQGTGDFDVLDFTGDGWVTLAIAGDHTLTTANASTSTTLNEAGARCLKLTTAVATYTQTLPALEGWYLIWNATTASQTIATSGGGTSVSILAGEIVFVMCDATNVKRLTLLTMGSNRLQNVSDPTGVQDAATKNYVDNTAFTMAAGALPGQGGNAGKFLGTDGTTAAWTSISATATQVRTGTTTTSALTPGDTYNALAEVTLTDAATIAVDMATFINARVTLGGNRTLGNPTNPKVGQSGYFAVVQDGTGSRTLAYASNYKFEGGAPVLTTTIGAIDFILYTVITSTYILCTIIRSPS